MVVFVTGNKGKVKEANSILDAKIEKKDIGYKEIQSDSLIDIAECGVIQSHKKLEKPCFVEDSGLFIHDLDGFPGPYSSYVYKTLGNKGILKTMKKIEDRKATFRSVISYCDKSGIKTFMGEVSGQITKESRGEFGFGFDPIFEYENYTFAEMKPEEKNEVSHRKASLEKFANWYQDK